VLSKTDELLHVDGSVDHIILTCYKPGARFGPHVDNRCTHARGEACNGRRLAVVYYANAPDRLPSEGGALRLLGPATGGAAGETGAAGATASDGADGADDAGRRSKRPRLQPACTEGEAAPPLFRHGVQPVDVQPVGDRLCLFWADTRVRHEVLPAASDRCAVMMWFEDPTEMMDHAEMGGEATPPKHPRS
jgi:hypothetical protein